MPRYFFDLHNGTTLRDEVGLELPDLAAVSAEARRALGEIAAHGNSVEQGLEVGVDVRNDAGQRVLTAKLIMKIERGA